MERVTYPNAENGYCVLEFRVPGEVSEFNRTNDLLNGEGEDQIAPLIRNKSSARFPHLGPHISNGIEAAHRPAPLRAAGSSPQNSGGISWSLGIVGL